MQNEKNPLSDPYRELVSKIGYIVDPYDPQITAAALCTVAADLIKAQSNPKEAYNSFMGAISGLCKEGQ